MPTNYFQELYSNKDHFKDRTSLLKGIGLEGVSDVDEIVHALLEYPNLVIEKEMLAPLRVKEQSCKKNALYERCVSVGLPVIPTIEPKTLDEVKSFCKANGTVIVKPVVGHDCIGFKEYHYRPIEEKELLEELELDLRFIENQNSNAINQAVLQKFIPLDEKDAYHYSFKGWVNNDGEFTLSHSFTESWGVDPTYDSTQHDRLTKQALSNALASEKTTFETDKAVDDEVIRQTNEFCKNNIDSAFMHGDAIVADGKVYLIDMSPVSNFRTMVAFALEGLTKHLFFAITMPKTGNRQKQVDLASEHGGFYSFSDRFDPNRYKYLVFLFTGSSLKEIHANREAYVKAISGD